MRARIRQTVNLTATISNIGNSGSSDIMRFSDFSRSLQIAQNCLASEVNRYDRPTIKKRQIINQNGRPVLICQYSVLPREVSPNILGSYHNSYNTDSYNNYIIVTNLYIAGTSGTDYITGSNLGTSLNDSDLSFDDNA
jgi:hypothetical protein